MAVNRAQVVESRFLEFIESWARKPGRASVAGEFRREDVLAMFRAQLQSRLIDYEARRLKEANQGYYTIGSAGHEGNVALGALLRKDDPCFLHYRSGALMLRRLLLDPTMDPVQSVLLSFTAAKADPVSGGRHKVWGSKSLWIPPQTSTIASHLPKAVGMAIAIERSKRVPASVRWPKDAIVLCSFGDASLNHSTAQGALNAAAWATFQRLPVPILFVCEDNGIGISVHTPKDWVQRSVETRPGIHYLFGDGLDLADAIRATGEAIDRCRGQRQPVFLHLRTTRLMGHAGSDVETEYLTREQIEAMESRDPLLGSADWILSEGWMTPGEILELYAELRDEIVEKARRAAEAPKLGSAEEVTRGLVYADPDGVRKAAESGNMRAGDAELPGSDRKRHMATLINWGLREQMSKHSNALVFGEDVAKKGGVYHVTTGLLDRFGAGRVFNTLLDEQTILGMAIGSAQAGYLPIPEIQYLAYFHNAEDQIRGEAASMQFFSNGQFKNPMVIRMASFAYQKGFGGHFHNDNAIGALRDIPGALIAVPSRGDDAVKMLRGLMASAAVEGRVSFLLEPIALYMTKDLHRDGDGAWSFAFPDPHEAVLPGEARVYGDETPDLLIISYANGLWFSLRVAERLRLRGHRIRVIDLRWLNPLPLRCVQGEASRAKSVLIVDECRRTGGGVVDSLSAAVLAAHPEIPLRSVTAQDSYIPLGPAANLVLPNEAEIELESTKLLGDLR